MLSIEEREERKKQVGASEIHKLLNFDTNECQDLWELKLSLQEYIELENDSITAGNILEEDCLDYYEKTTGKKLIRNERIENKRVKGLVVSLDAREEETNIPVENKVVNVRTWEKWKSKRVYNAEYEDIKLNIPKSYYYQLQAQITTLEVESGILNVNTLSDEEQLDPINVEISNEHNKQVVIHRNEPVIAMLESRAKYFLECVKHKKRPSENEFLEEVIF